MKRFLACFICFILVLGVCLLINPKEQKTPSILRIHIKASSNSQSDQIVKFKVKDSVTEYLSDKLCEVTSLSLAMQVVNSSLVEIERVGSATLLENGFTYKAKAELKVETFPTRVYDGITFDGGEYQSLMIYLGDGVGDNWWCVMYPPLCFIPQNASTTSQEFEYKSLIKQLLDKWREQNARNEQSE